MTAAPAPRKRSFLLLQGLATPFLFRLAEHLRAAGHETAKIHISGADLMFWPGPAALFRDRAAAWPEFLAGQMKRREVTDLILFGDCRPYHQDAIAVAQRGGITVHVFEEGYVRPGFITLEQGGTNAFSDFPRDPGAIRRLAERVPPTTTAVTMFTSFLRRATWDVAAQSLGLALGGLFRHYRWHGPDHPFIEYAGWIGRFATAPIRSRHNRRTVAALLGGTERFYLMPLQLDSDYQIRVHSPYRGMLDAIEDVVTSFARAAAPETFLVLKLHPLDPGLIPYRRRVAAIAKAHRVGSRIRVIGDGDLPGLVMRAEGVVLVNSTTGLLALRLGRPLKVLGRAIFDVPGLSFQGGLDAFWACGEHPDAVLFDAFLKLLLNRTQVEGDYFTAEGVEIGARNAAARILSRA